MARDITLSPEQSLEHLVLLSETYNKEKSKGPVCVSCLSDLEHPFSSTIVDDTQLSEPSLHVQLNGWIIPVPITRNDEKTNREALRILFRTALSEKQSTPTLNYEDMKGRVASFVLELDGKKDPEVPGETCSDILTTDVRKSLSSAATLDELNHVLGDTLTAMSLSIDIAEWVKNKTERPPLFDIACSKAQDLCKADVPEKALFCSVLRKLYDDGIVAVAVHLKNDPSLSSDQRNKLFQYHVGKVLQLFFKDFSSLPAWAKKSFALQSSASLIKATATLDLPNLEKAIQNLFAESKESADDAELGMFIEIYEDVETFLENTMAAVPPDRLSDKIRLDRLICDLSKKARKLKNRHDELKASATTDQPSLQSTGIKTQKVVKRILFNVYASAHHVLWQAFSAAFTAAFAEFVRGNGLYGAGFGFIKGASIDMAANVLQIGLTSGVDELPCSEPNKARARNYIRCFTPILKILLYLAPRWFHHNAPVQAESAPSPGSAPAMARSSEVGIRIIDPTGIKAAEVAGTALSSMNSTDTADKDQEPTPPSPLEGHVEFISPITNPEFSILAVTLATIFPVISQV